LRLGAVEIIRKPYRGYLLDFAYSLTSTVSLKSDFD